MAATQHANSCGKEKKGREEVDRLFGDDSKSSESEGGDDADQGCDSESAVFFW